MDVSMPSWSMSLWRTRQITCWGGRWIWVQSERLTTLWPVSARWVSSTNLSIPTIKIQLNKRVALKYNIRKVSSNLKNQYRSMSLLVRSMKGCTITKYPCIFSMKRKVFINKNRRSGWKVRENILLCISIEESWFCRLFRLVSRPLACSRSKTKDMKQSTSNTVSRWLTLKAIFT